MNNFTKKHPKFMSKEIISKLCLRIKGYNTCPKIIASPFVGLILQFASSKMFWYYNSVYTLTLGISTLIWLNGIDSLKDGENNQLHFEN